MTKPMSVYRLEDLSMIYFVKEVFLDFPNVIIVNEFPKTILQVPTISIINRKLIEERFEIGNRDSGLRTRRWFIDIFGSSVSQRDDFAYEILDTSDNGMTVYDYNEGFPPSVSPAAVNHLSVISKSYEPLDIPIQDNEKVHYRGQIILITTNDKV
jgi:hypothetical protein